MSGLRLLAGKESTPAEPVFAQALTYDATQACLEDGVPLCELLVDSALAGVYDPSRGFILNVSGPSEKLSDQPERVHALMCASGSGLGGEASFVALLAPANGPTFILPRAGALSASQVRVRHEGSTAASAIAVARGMDPYTTLLMAVKVAAELSGSPEADVHAHVLPLLDSVNRMRYDTALAAMKRKGVDTDAANLTAYEQQLHENILVQAGPDCPAKPLLQAPGIRLCQGMSVPLGLRYSGMSVVYGTATDHVLAVLDTASALRMAPASTMRGSGAGAVMATKSSVSVCSTNAGANSPSAVSAGVSETTSATPSPPMSRANSCGGIAGADSPILDAAAAATTITAAPRTPGPLVKVLSGRSITAAPVIQILTTAPNGSVADGAGLLTPTGAPTQVLSSFAIVGIKSSGGRNGYVRCCRIMPASTVDPAGMTATAVEADAAVSGAAKLAAEPGLGLVVQLDVVSTTAGTLLMFVEGPDGTSEISESLDSWEDSTPVRGVSIDGRPARWKYDSTGAMLGVEIPSSAPPQQAPAVRQVQVFL